MSCFFSQLIIPARPRHLCVRIVAVFRSGGDATTIMIAAMDQMSRTVVSGPSSLDLHVCNI